MKNGKGKLGKSDFLNILYRLISLNSFIGAAALWSAAWIEPFSLADALSSNPSGREELFSLAEDDIKSFFSKSSKEIPSSSFR